MITHIINTLPTTLNTIIKVLESSSPSSVSKSRKYLSFQAIILLQAVLIISSLISPDSTALITASR